MQVLTFAFIGQIFTDKRPLVNNLVSLGKAVVSIPLSLALQIWINNYGWYGCLLLMGGVVLQALPFSLLLTHIEKKFPETVGNKLNKAKEGKLIDGKLLKNKIFIIYVISCGFHVASMVIVSIYLIRFAQSLNIDSIAAASLRSVIACVSIFLRPIVGFISSKEQVCGWVMDRTIILIFVLLFQTISTILLALISVNFNTILLCTILYSIALGCCGNLPVTLLADLFGTQNLMSSIGFRSFTIGVFSLVAPPFAALFVDIEKGNSLDYNSYRTPFYISSICSTVSCVLLYVSRYFNNSQPIEKLYRTKQAETTVK